LRSLSTAAFGEGRHHKIPGELIVSLTSYLPRFATLHLTLQSLLAQSVKPDRLVLWIAHGDTDLLPAAVRELEKHGLEIRECDDLKSYKKLVPALCAFPDSFIVTADDDLYFPPDWLSEIVSGFAGDYRSICCRRAVRLNRSASGELAPFLDWQHRVTDRRARQPSADIVAETGAGALFPPRSLHPVATKVELFQRLAPTADDLWFFWCARMAGTSVYMTGGKSRLITWAGSQDESLWADNREGGNDRTIRALIDEFGMKSLGLDEKQGEPCR
jgi:hypothetical protein